jgi:hypothetical protein
MYYIHMQVLIKYLLEKHTQMYMFIIDLIIQETNHRKESFVYIIPL